MQHFHDRIEFILFSNMPCSLIVNLAVRIFVFEVAHIFHLNDHATCLKVKHWQNKETCYQKHLLWAHVSPMFPSFVPREALSPEARCVSASRQKYIPVWQNISRCMSAMLRDVIIVVREPTRPRALSLAMLSMKKGFPISMYGFVWFLQFV